MANNFVNSYSPGYYNPSHYTAGSNSSRIQTPPTTPPRRFTTSPEAHSPSPISDIYKKTFQDTPAARTPFTEIDSKFNSPIPTTPPRRFTTSSEVHSPSSISDIYKKTFQDTPAARTPFTEIDSKFNSPTPTTPQKLPIHPGTPINAKPTSQYSSTPIESSMKTRQPMPSPVTFNYLINSPNTSLPTAAQSFRNEMASISKKYEDLLDLLKKFGCTKAITFSDLCNERFPGFTFPSADQNKKLQMSAKLRAFNNSFNSSITILKDLNIAYKAYRNLINTCAQYEAIRESERNLETAQLLIKDKINELESSFKSFVFELLTYIAKTPISDEATAFSTYCELNRKYTFGVTKRNMPNTFAGMDFAYKKLLNHHRAIEGTMWLTRVMEAFLISNGAKLNLNQRYAINIFALSDWVNAMNETISEQPRLIQDIVHEVNQITGCWFDKPTNESSLQAYYRFHLNNGKPIEPNQTINCPFMEPKPLPKEMDHLLYEINQKFYLELWIQEVSTKFNPTKGWASDAPIKLKEMAVLIECKGSNVRDADVVAIAKNLAKSIIHYMYTVELTNDEQQ